MPSRRRRIPFSQELQQRLALAKGNVAMALFISQSLDSIPIPRKILKLSNESQLTAAYSLIVQQLYTSSTILARRFAAGNRRDQIPKASQIPLWARPPIVRAAVNIRRTLQNPLTPSWARPPLTAALTELSNLLGVSQNHTR
ncbi:hypothetical protein [Marininema halotolerans]|uniref:Uncharacterized protein n=1 Tax=Marininema halotolerans TaxID=1155944 RepID=A0A1I6SFK8_9BACL|nr:hypothetical protein [Marininema halotolerans]SFS75752.1 hypothetical protein SAMN05444972_10749 [Marininema halotolerans]